MKKKIMVIVIAAVVGCLGISGAAYAAWRRDAVNTNNTVQMGSEVNITLDKADGTKYFDGAALAGQGSETAATAITVTNAGGASYMLKVSVFTISGETFDYTADDLYVKVADTEAGLTDAAAVKFEQGVVLIASNTASSKTVYIKIGLGASAKAEFAGRTVTFGIATSAN